MSNTSKNKWKKFIRRGIAGLLTVVMVITLLISNRWGVVLALDEETQAVEILQLPPGQIVPSETTETPSTEGAGAAPGTEGAGATPGTSGDNTGLSGDYVNFSDILGAEKEPSAEAPPEGGGQNADVSAVSGQPENGQDVSGQDVSGQDVSGQPKEEMTDAVKAFLAAMDELLELADNDAPAEEMLAAIKYARRLYEDLTDEEKAIPEVAERKEALDSFDGVITLAMEMQVSTKDDLKNAAKNIEVGGTIKLVGNIELEGHDILDITKNLTLDLNGHELKQVGEADVIKVVDRNVTFTLTDSSTSGNGVITGGKSSHVGGSFQDGGYYGGAVCCYGNFIMDGGTISGNNTRGTGYGGGVYCEGNFTMKKGTIKGNQAVYGGAVFCRGNFTMLGGTIESNQAKYGGGVYCLGKFTMSDGTIDGNTSGLYGGGVFCENDVEMSSNGTISGNNAGGNYEGATYDGEGGGVYCNGNFTMTGGTVTNNNKNNNENNSSGVTGNDVTYGGNFNHNGGTVSNKEQGKIKQPRPVSVRQPEPPVHGHKYTQTKPPSCMENGEERCGCGLTRVLPALGGHSYGAGAVTVEPACETAGVRTFTCGRCGNAKTESVPALGGHSYNNGTITTAAKCETAGVRTFTCDRCGNAKTEAVPALGHNYDDGTITTAATCENTGVRTFTCGWCGDAKTGMVLALGHNYNIRTITTIEKCETAGVRRFICERCDRSRMESIPALGHNYDDGTITTAATCENTGIRTFTCGECGDVKTGMVLALGHNYDNETITTAAECETAGVRMFTCGRCNRSRMESVPAIGHRWDNGTVTEEPTQTKEGVRTYTCQNDASHKRTAPVARLKGNGGTADTVNTASAADTAPEMQCEYPTYRNVAPDPNAPESPEVIVVIDDDGVTETYRRVQDPGDSEKMVYIEDSSIPLAATETEKTGNWGVLALIMTLVSVSVGIVVIFNTRREKQKA